MVSPRWRVDPDMPVYGLLELIRTHQTYQRLIAGLGDHWSGQKSLGTIPEAAKPPLLAALYRDLSHGRKRDMLIVTPQAEDARRLYEQIRLWVPVPERVFSYPDPDGLPYQRVTPDPTTIRQRLTILAYLGGLAPLPPEDSPSVVVVCSVHGLMHLTLAPRAMTSMTRIVRCGQRMRLSDLIRHTQDAGYIMVNLVDEVGTVSHRGGIVDIWPPTSPQPVRVEFVGDDVESIRLFDPASQLSQQRTDRVVITPAQEALPVDAPGAADALATVNLESCHTEARQRWHTDIERLRAGACTGQPYELLSFYAAYFGNTATILDHFNGIVILDEPHDIEVAGHDMERQAEEYRHQLVARGDLPDGVRAPLMPWAHVQEALARHPCLTLSWQGNPTEIILPIQPAPVYGGQMARALADIVTGVRDGHRVVIATHQAQRLAELLEERSLTVVPQDVITSLPPPGSITIVQGSLAEGWIWSEPAHPLWLITDTELFGWAKQRRATGRRRAPRETFWADLSPGDHVVHVDHGIALYRGLVTLTSDGATREYLELEYAEGDRLYVPVEHADRVSRYIGTGGTPPTLTRLSGTDWDRIKNRTRRAVREVARELLEIYAMRAAMPGHAFSPDSPWQRELEASFPYGETPDQLAAISDVKADMERPQPMDRLICGDVGYGKTEVALRAAFKAVMDGKQVAMLVPTTILAQQHMATFQARLAAYPVRIEMLSRFRSQREQEEIIAGLQRGEVDIVIGTHRLLQKDVTFKDLGLVIIDEEQRFGVLHKERLKQLRREVDVLTLTATPIPRTLHMSLVGVRDMSVIDTPPEDRLPIITTVSAYDETLIREAILREVDRGGQVYFVHNRVQSIDYMARRLRHIVPEATIAVAHGQMPEDELERVMLDFADGRVDVLVCTAIIESGLDIPNANTIIINRAHQFGLAQLYQLRGRVGRGANRAYAYLLHDRDFQLTETAERRLRAIFEAQELGAGFRIAMKDLEIRGAGNILGVEQHGHIAAVGFDLYTRLLAEEVERLKRDGATTHEPEAESPPQDQATPGPSVTLPLDAYIPPTYVTDEPARLALYQRLATVPDEDHLENIRNELRDRFGPFPPPVENLFYALRVRRMAAAIGAESVVGREHELVIRLNTPGVPHQETLRRRFGPSIRMGTQTVTLDRHRLGRSWPEALLAALTIMAGGKDPPPLR